MHALTGDGGLEAADSESKARQLKKDNVFFQLKPLISQKAAPTLNPCAVGK